MGELGFVLQLRVHVGRLQPVQHRALRADWADGWGLVRASNTTPVLVLRFDADNPVALKRIQQVFREQLFRVDPALKLPF